MGENFCYYPSYAGAKLDDALSTIAIDRDMLRPPRPKALRLKEREPVKRKRLTDQSAGVESENPEGSASVGFKVSANCACVINHSALGARKKVL